MPSNSKSTKGKGVKKELKTKGIGLTFKSLARPGPAQNVDKSRSGKISIGSDCAGLLSEGTALELLQIPHEHKFAAEQNVAVRHLLYDTYGKKAMRYYKDCTTRNNEAADAVDLYVFGFPCTPYSPAGHGAGMLDERSSPLLHCLQYIKMRRPTLVIAENSHRFTSARSVVTMSTMSQNFELMCLFG